MKKVFTRLTALIIVIGAVLSDCSKSPEAESPGSDGGAPETEAVIAGTIADITNASIAVETDGGVYLFERDDTLMHVDSGLLLTGRSITVTYTGTLAENLSVVQDVKVISFHVKADNLSGLPSAGTDDDEVEAGTETGNENNAAPASGRAQEILGTMTLEEKVAQLFLVRCPEENAAQIAQQYQFGGYTLFGRDFKDHTPDQVISDIQSYQNASKIPMLIAVDEEGGTVTRISSYSQFRAVPFWSPRDLYAEGGLDLVQSDTEEKCQLLKSLGLNLNLAPVCDISTNPVDFIYERSFGGTPEETADYVALVISTMNENGIGSALKHFPGYGSNADTHTGIAIDDRSLESFRENDLIPFKAGIDAGAPVVLVSHNIINAIDPDRPASLSPQVHELLRGELGFDGIIMTDDLYMDAIRDYTGGEEAAVMAIAAGNDLLCCSDYEIQYSAVLSAVLDGTISEARIDESVLRILNYKLNYGLIS